MITPIIIDTSSLLDQFTSLDGGQINNMLDNIAKGIAANYAQKLEQMAAQELHQTRNIYISNIKLIDSGKLEGTVMLDYSKNKLVQMIEEGAEAFDMKEGFLNSPKVKIGKKGGKYLTIPFRWGTPGIVGDADVFVGSMPVEIYNVVKNKPSNIPTSGGGSRTAGIALKEIPAQFQLKKVRPAIVDNQGNKEWDAYEHKHSIYEGISQQNDSATGQNTYQSFRRVSDKSDDDAWIHPGIKRYNLMQRTLTEFNTENELSLQIDSELNKLGLI